MIRHSVGGSGTVFPAATSPVPEKIYLQPETWHTVLVSSSISPGAPPSRHPCERNASGPRARLSSVESDLQGDPWHGSLRYPRGSTARPRPFPALSSFAAKRLAVGSRYGINLSRPVTPICHARRRDAKDASHHPPTTPNPRRDPAGAITPTDGPGDAMMAPPASTPRAGTVVPSVVCKHSNAPAARAIQPEACARVGRRGAVEAEAPTRAQ